MKDYIITLATVFAISLLLLGSHIYARNTGYIGQAESVSDESFEENNNNQYYNNYYDNNYIPQQTATTTSSQQNSFTFMQNTTTIQPVEDTTEDSVYDESESEYESEIDTTTTTTTFKSILEQAKNTTTTVHQFNIIQNPDSVPDSAQDKPPVSVPDDFTLIID